MKLKGEVAVITGSSKGIGRFIALEFAKEGAKVVVNYSKSKDEAVKVVREIQELGSEAIEIQADVSSEGDVKKLFDETVKNYGYVSILVNNAGHGSKAYWNLSLWDINKREWDEVFSIDLWGAFLCSKEASKIMLNHGHGSIVNITSTPGVAGGSDGIIYAIAKSGVVGLTRTLANILAPKIRVNAVALGSIRTDWLQWISNKEIEELINHIPLKRLGEPEEVAKVVLFLASQDSSYITGQVIIVDGGVVTW
ncbi:MAG: SDR family NAD(P)-dependent oxidoreductase [Thermoprotei archaeon]